ncbi:MAG: esterase family protein [Spirochaetales bacterium]|nr:esterase family protein [Spirochaetales bacterium]
MALIDCNFYSEVLGLSTSMMVILPQQPMSQIGMENIAHTRKHKTLYLLHGLSDDHTTWTRRTSIERYVTPLEIAVVMPNVHRSFYTDMCYGGAYETFIALELPEICRSFFPLSHNRDDTFIAGISMGGYGAFKCALRYPQNYRAAASLSGVLDVANNPDNPPVNIEHDLINIFGSISNIAGTKNDLFYIVKQLKEKGEPIPELYQCCGNTDFLYAQNIAFRDFAKKEELPLTWQEDPGYDHTWEYWDIRIQTVLEWMFR